MIRASPKRAQFSPLNGNGLLQGTAQQWKSFLA